MANGFLVFGVLANADVELVVVNHGRGGEGGERAPAAELVAGIFRVAIELPDELAGLWLERIHPAVAAREDDLSLTVRFRIGRAGPLAVHQDETTVHEVLQTG